jgi:hypothetical protein
MTTERERLVALLTAMDASETALRRDPPIRGQQDPGDWAIWGRDDNDDSKVPIGMSCHVYPDGDGYLIYFMAADTGDREPSSLPWKNAKAKLAFCQVTQDGDWEGCLRLDRLPTSDEAKAIRETLGIRKRRHLSADQKERARSVLSSARTLNKSAKRPPPIRSAA